MSQQAWYCISDKGRGDANNTVQDRMYVVHSKGVILPNERHKTCAPFSSFVWLSPAQDGVISLVGGSTAGASKLALLVLQSTVNAPTNLLDSSHKILASILNCMWLMLSDSTLLPENGVPTNRITA